MYSLTLTPCFFLRLTAFVLKSFTQAHGFTYIDPLVMEKGVMFIMDQQLPDGGFNSTGFVHNKAMQVEYDSRSGCVKATFASLFNIT